MKVTVTIPQFVLDNPIAIAAVLWIPIGIIVTRIIRCFPGNVIDSEDIFPVVVVLLWPIAIAMGAAWIVLEKANSLFAWATKPGRK